MGRFKVPVFGHPAHTKSRLLDSESPAEVRFEAFWVKFTLIFEIADGKNQGKFEGRLVYLARQALGISGRNLECLMSETSFPISPFFRAFV